MRRKGQLMTFDFSASIVIFLIFLATFTSFLLINSRVEQKNEVEFELEYTFNNFQNNLAYDTNANNIAFINKYRINKNKLNNFASINDIDPYIIGNISNPSSSGSHGIGLDTEAYDTCLYFTDTDNSILEIISGTWAVGTLKEGTTCNSKISLGSNPCTGYMQPYEQTIAFFKPVLLLAGDADDNRIIQMNIVICKV